MAFTMKTYNDSYLYKTKINKSQKDNPDKKANAAIKDFIITSQRIEDKSSDAFRGIAEEVKRLQRSSSLYSILMMDNVKLCIGNSEMPRAFKVFDAKDPKSGGNPVVFIDVTGLIEYRNGYYSCRKSDVLLAYLFDAMIYLLYRYFPNKIVDNSNVTLAATECYVSMFNYIIDHERVVGFSVNKNKITYLAALFFLHNMMGKELNDYTKTIAAQVSKTPKSDIRAYDLYLSSEDNIFDNIATFIDYIVRTFNLNGFNLAIFVKKWMYLYGTGTEYACELYTSFLVLIANSYAGCYIVQQRTIENVCKSYMVKVCLEIEKAASTTFSRGLLSNRDYREATEIHSKNTRELSEAVRLRERSSEFLSINEDDFHVKNAAKDIATNAIKFCKESRLEDKISPFAEKVILTGLDSAYNSCYFAITNEEYQLYEEGTLLEAAKTFKNQFTNKQRYNIEKLLNENIENLRELIRESKCDKEFTTSVSRVISEMREMQQYI